MDAPSPSNPTPPAARSARLFVVILLGLGILGALWLGIREARDARPHPAGLQAPKVGFQRFGGGAVSLQSLRGKVVLVDFWATFCAPCVEEMPVLVKLAREYEPQGLVFVAPSLDDPDRAVVEVGAFIDRRVPGLAPYAAFGNDA